MQQVTVSDLSSPSLALALNGGTVVIDSLANLEDVAKSSAELVASDAPPPAELQKSAAVQINAAQYCYARMGFMAFEEPKGPHGNRTASATKKGPGRYYARGAQKAKNTRARRAAQSRSGR